LKNSLIFNRRNLAALLLIALVLIILIAAIAYLVPPGADWQYGFRPAVYAILNGHSPYNLKCFVDPACESAGFFNAPWALLPLIPLALLPVRIGYAVLIIVSLASFGWVAYRLGAKPLTIGLLLVSPPVVHGVLVGNLDWLVALGFVMPPQIGLFFIIIKPQMGAAVALFWLIEAWRLGGWRRVLRTFWPATLALLISVLIFGLWPLHFERMTTQWWNASLWPLTIPVGLALLVSAIRKRKIEYAMGASPCLSPYLMMHSWVAALLALSGSLPEMAAAVAGFWILIILRALGQ
jgi:hypothetical protein